MLSSPLFTGPGSSGLFNYQQAAFETDLPRIEGTDSSPNNVCQRHVFNPSDPSPGTGCVNPPNGASFHSFFSTGTAGGQRVWEEGGPFVAGATNPFGGSSTAEFGNFQVSVYPAVGNTTQGIYENFDNTLATNPCPAAGGTTGE